MWIKMGELLWDLGGGQPAKRADYRQGGTDE
jgi:hypothetical protein